MSTTARHSVRAATEDASVTPLELFFDLVFVYALTQVTALMADDPSGEGVLHGMIVLALFWWCWVGYSWLGNTVQADEGLTRATFFFVMAVMFVASLAIPESFDDLPGGLDAPLVLAVCYALVRLAHIGLYVLAAEGDAGLARQLAMFAPVVLVVDRAGGRGRPRGRERPGRPVGRRAASSTSAAPRRSARRGGGCALRAISPSATG